MDTTTMTSTDHPQARGLPPRARDVAVTWETDVRPRPRSVAIGSFDGVHVGHQQVIGGACTVLTFEPHPLRVLRPEAAPPLLTVLGRKAQRLAQLGVSEVVVIPFDRVWAERDARSFIDEVLVARLGARHVSVGANFRFGARGVGDPDLLLADDRFSTTVVPLLGAGDDTSGEEVVSSTRIRRLVAEGEVERAARLLQAPLTQPAHVDTDGRVSFDPILAVPTAGRYEVTARGRRGTLCMGCPPVLRPASGAPFPPGVVTVTFMRRLTSH